MVRSPTAEGERVGKGISGICSGGSCNQDIRVIFKNFDELTIIMTKNSPYEIVKHTEKKCMDLNINSQFCKIFMYDETGKLNP